jgi:hypothetical protein
MKQSEVGAILDCIDWRCEADGRVPHHANRPGLKHSNDLSPAGLPSAGPPLGRITVPLPLPMTGEKSLSFKNMYFMFGVFPDHNCKIFESLLMTTYPSTLLNSFPL